MNKEKIVNTLASNWIEPDELPPTHTNEMWWTLADLFIRQELNNGCDGFGMVNVRKMFNLLSKHKQLLIDNDMLSKDGYNNSGFPLWKNHNFDTWIFAQGEEEE